jgi:hypothetical protein
MSPGDSQVGAANGQATDSASQALGNVSSVFGIGSILFDAVVAAANAINGSLSDLEVLLNAIYAVAAQLEDHLKAQDITQRLETINSGMSYAETELKDLQGNLNKQLTDGDRSRIIDQCTLTMTTLDGVDNPLHAVWYAPWQDQEYWSDYVAFPQTNPFSYCHGPQDSIAPEPDGTGRVFNYVYILPAYMNALSIFITVAGTLDPKFVANYGGTVVSPALDLLSKWHDKIQGEGIILLSPVEFRTVPRPQPWSPLQPPVQWTGALFGEAILATQLASMTQQPPSGLPFLTGVTLNVAALQASIKYGAVEKFSGDSSIGTYTIQLTRGFEGPGLPDVYLFSRDPSPYKKFQIRLLKKAKDVYIGVGLLAVWNSINAVGSLLGRAPLGRPNFADWSFRAISKIVGLTSLKAIRTFMVSTPPIDTPPLVGSTGFRALLEV